MYSLGALRRHACFGRIRDYRISQRIRVHAEVSRFFGLGGLLLAVDLGGWVLSVLELLL
jgi:type IV secretory pathway TrbF-like protein